MLVCQVKTFSRDSACEESMMALDDEVNAFLLSKPKAMIRSVKATEVGSDCGYNFTTTVVYIKESRPAMTDQKPMTFEECVEKAAVFKLPLVVTYIKNVLCTGGDITERSGTKDDHDYLIIEEENGDGVIAEFSFGTAKYAEAIVEAVNGFTELQATNDGLTEKIGECESVIQIHVAGVEQLQATLAERDKTIGELREALQAGHVLRVHYAYGPLDWAAKYGDMIDSDQSLIDMTASFDRLYGVALSEQPERPNDPVGQMFKECGVNVKFVDCTDDADHPGGKEE